MALSESSKKDEKLLNFFSYLKDFARPLDLDQILSHPSSTSLLGLLALASIKKYIEIFRREELALPSDARFITNADKQVLDQRGLIDIDLNDEQDLPSNVEKIKRRYDQFLGEYMRLEQVKESYFSGAYERAEIKRHSKELEQLKSEMVTRMRKYIIDLPYDTNADDDPSIRKIKKSSMNMYLNTRIVRLYDMLRSTPKYYQIPWLFYDVLCYLKQSVQLFKSGTNSIPIAIPNEWLNCFSAEKLKNLKIEE